MRDLVEKFRTIYWYEFLRQKTGLESAYSLEKRFEPAAFKLGPNDQVLCHRNKWSSYRSGKRTPRRSLVERVERQAQGSAHQINHVLWDVLRLQKSALEHSAEWVSRLDLEIQKIAFGTASSASSPRQRRPVARRMLNVLLTRPSLDALALATLLIRESAEREDFQSAFLCVPQTLFLLLVVFSSAPMTGFAVELFNFYRQRILILGANSDGERFTLDDYPFGEGIGFLNEFVATFEATKGRPLDKERALLIKMKVLLGTYGFDARIRYWPRPGADAVLPWMN